MQNSWETVYTLMSPNNLPWTEKLTPPGAPRGRPVDAETRTPESTGAASCDAPTGQTAAGATLPSSRPC